MCAVVERGAIHGNRAKSPERLDDRERGRADVLQLVHRDGAWAPGADSVEQQTRFGAATLVLSLVLPSSVDAATRRVQF